MSDRIMGLFGLLFAGIMFWATGQIEESFIQDPLGPKAFPSLITALIAISSVIMIIRPDANPAWPPLKKWLELIITVGVMVAYGAILPELGFVLSSILMAAFMIQRLGGTVVQSLVAGTLTSVGIYFVFGFGLQLSLAKGPWGF